MDNEKHNGYTNYPTWLLASSIDNDELMYNFFRSFKGAELGKIIEVLEEMMSTNIRFMRDVNECLLNYAKEQINVQEIARMIKED